MEGHRQVAPGHSPDTRCRCSKKVCVNHLLMTVQWQCLGPLHINGPLCLSKPPSPCLSISKTPKLMKSNTYKVLLGQGMPRHRRKGGAPGTRNTTIHPAWLHPPAPLGRPCVTRHGGNIHSLLLQYTKLVSLFLLLNNPSLAGLGWPQGGLNGDAHETTPGAVWTSSGHGA